MPLDFGFPCRSTQEIDWILSLIRSNTIERIPITLREYSSNLILVLLLSIVAAFSNLFSDLLFFGYEPFGPLETGRFFRIVAGQMTVEPSRGFRVDQFPAAPRCDKMVYFVKHTTIVLTRKTKSNAQDVRELASI